MGCNKQLAAAVVLHLYAVNVLIVIVTVTRKPLEVTNFYKFFLS